MLWTLLDQGAGAGTTVIAAQQRSGRGQWGRQWYSPPGGLYLSLAMVFKTCKAGTPINSPYWVTQSGHLTLSSAWGIATALRGYAIPVQIKWPNDLLLHGHKLGGILTETRSYQGQITTAVIGVGINWTNSVPEAGINLDALQPNPIRSLEMLAAITLEGLEAGYQRWQEGDLLPDYLELLTPIGHPVQDLTSIMDVSAAGDPIQLDPGSAARRLQ